MGKTALDGNSTALLEELRKIIDTSGVPEAGKLLSVKAVADEEGYRGPLFEIHCRGLLYSRLPYSGTESTLCSIVEGMRLVKSAVE